MGEIGLMLRNLVFLVMAAAAVVLILAVAYLVYFGIYAE
jgi:hypothetical protein